MEFGFFYLGFDIKIMPASRGSRHYLTNQNQNNK